MTRRPNRDHAQTAPAQCGKASTSGQPNAPAETAPAGYLQPTCHGVKRSLATAPAATAPASAQPKGPTPDAMEVMGIPKLKKLQLGEQVANRYRVVETLGEGGMGAVYRVWDEEAQIERALKVIKASNPTKLRTNRDALSREFLAMCKFRHPNIVAVYDYGFTDESMPFFTMDYVPGDTLQDILDSSHEFPIHSLCREVMLALSAIHGQGMLHADLKPANVLIDTRDGTPRARLADFGLAAKIEDFSTERILGTVPFLAPERIQRKFPDIRTDLYALGVLLYVLHTGQLPFGDGPSQDVMNRHLHQHPRPPSELNPSLSPEWEEVILRLLEKEPDLRYHSVDEALEAWEGHVSNLHTTPSSRALYCDSSVGRDVETQIFQDHWKALPDKGHWLVLTGSVGVGKRHVLNQWKIRTQMVQGNWIQVQPHRDVPFSPMSDVFETLSTQFSYPALKRIIALLKRTKRSEALIHKNGAPQPACEVQQTSPEEAREALFHQLSLLLNQVDFPRPTVVALENMEQAEPDTLSLLRHLMLHHPELPLLWIVTGQQEEREWNKALLPDDLPNATSIDLKPLSREDVQQLLNNLLGNIKGISELTECLMQQSHGNPLWVMELLQVLQEKGALHRAHGSWLFDPIIARQHMSHLQQSLSSLLAEKLQRCTPQEQEVLGLMAAWSEPIPDNRLQSLLAAQSNPTKDLLPWNHNQVLQSLQERGLCATESRAGKTTYVLVPPSLKDVVLKNLSSAKLQAIHQQIYALFHQLRRYGHHVSAVRMTRHALATEDWDTVIKSLPAAKQECLATHAYEQGLTLFQKVLHHISIENEPILYAQTQMTLADFSRYLGRFEEASHSLHQVLSALTESAEEEAIVMRVNCLHGLGRDANRSGQYEEALEFFHSAMDHIRVRSTRNSFHRWRAKLWRGMGWSHMMQAQYQQALEACDNALGEVTPQEDHILCCQVHRLQAAIAFYQGKPDAVQHAAQQALTLALEHNDLRGQAEAHFKFGNLANLQGNYDQAIRSFEQAYKLFESLELLEAMGRCRNNLGVASYLLGEWSEAIHHWEHFATICKLRNDRAQHVNALNNFAFLYKDRGQFHQARNTLEEAISIAEADGLERLAATLHGNLGETLWRLGELEEAKQHLEHAIAVATKLNASNEVVENQRRLLGIALEEEKGEDVEAEILRIMSELKANPMPQEQAHLLLLWGMLWLQRGAPLVAWSSLVQAEELFAEQSATFEEARCWVQQVRAMGFMGQKRKVRSLAEKALERFSMLGAQWDVSQLQHVLENSIRTLSNPYGLESPWVWQNHDTSSSQPAATAICQ